MLNDINPASAPEQVRKGRKVAKPILYRAVKWLTPEAIEQAKLQHEAREDARIMAEEEWLEREFKMWNGDV